MLTSFMVSISSLRATFAEMSFASWGLIERGRALRSERGDISELLPFSFLVIEL